MAKLMDEKTFKENFISTFLATWTANNFNDYCMRGKQEDLENPPVEDAIYLADKAWIRYSRSTF